MDLHTLQVTAACTRHCLAADPNSVLCFCACIVAGWLPSHNWWLPLATTCYHRQALTSDSRANYWVQSPVYILSMDHTENTASNSSIVCIPVATEARLPSRFLATTVFSGFQAPCHNISNKLKTADSR
jgi:hypothetical protein